MAPHRFDLGSLAKCLHSKVHGGGSWDVAGHLFLRPTDICSQTELGLLESKVGVEVPETISVFIPSIVNKINLTNYSKDLTS